MRISSGHSVANALQECFGLYIPAVFAKVERRALILCLACLTCAATFDPMIRAVCLPCYFPAVAALCDVILL